MRSPKQEILNSVGVNMLTIVTSGLAAFLFVYNNSPHGTGMGFFVALHIAIHIVALILFFLIRWLTKNWGWIVTLIILVINLLLILVPLIGILLLNY